MDQNSVLRINNLAPEEINQLLNIILILLPLHDIRYAAKKRTQVFLLYYIQHLTCTNLKEENLAD